MAKAKKEPKTVTEEVKEKTILAPEAIVSGQWFKVTPEQLAQLQIEGRLVGYNPETNEALIK